MYHHATFCPLSRLRFFVVCAMLLVGVVKMGYGQRVYANASSVATDVDRGCILLVCGTVNNPMNPVTMTQILLGNPSTITAPLALSSTEHNIRFTGTNALPAPYAPVMVKIRVNNSLLSLVNSISIQRTNNGVNNVVGNSYTVGSLLDLLGIGSGGSGELTVILPIPGPTQINNGVQVSVEGVLSVGKSADLFYAFYIAPPEIPTTVTECENTPVEVTVANYAQAISDLGYPYTYELYTDQLPPPDPLVTETPIENVTFNDGTLTLPADLPARDYYLEARENGIYPSARTKITLVRNESPSISLITSTINICLEEDLISLPYASVANDPISYSIDWTSAAETAGFEDVSDEPHTFLLAGSIIPIPKPTSVAEGSYQGAITIKNASGCVSNDHTFTVTVLPKPAAPNLNIDPHSQY